MLEPFQLIKSVFFNLISPPFCECCRKFLEQRSILCFACIGKIKPVVTHSLSVTNSKKLPVYAIGAYEEPLKGLVLAKNRFSRLASLYLAEQIYARTPFRSLACDYLVPIPLHWSRRIKRGYNQSEEMAKHLAKLHSNASAVDILQRHRATKYQSGLSKIERADNLQGSISLVNLEQNIFAGKDLVLVDDVVTSGATLIAAAKELYKLKPKSIVAVVACRASG